MVRFVVILALLLVTGYTNQALAGNKHARPQPLRQNFDSFVLLSARSSDLRLFMPAYASGKTGKLLEWEHDLNAYSQQWLDKKGKIADQQLLHQLFYDVHRRYLKHYTKYTGLQALFQTGEYNCLSATAFYALILERLGYHYQIIESINHIVLLVKPQNGQLILLETTDPANGFVANTNGVKERLQAIKNSEQAAGYYNLNLKIFRTIDLRELAGLQYYNYAAWHFNQRSMAHATDHLRRGQLLYRSERFEKTARLISGR
ncbi:hypothetical protein [Cesiribacter sp. SM1]|uniref:hypothetical protein n=1 Tax=Cesiribacter sp. SM1 TaxID=2861196 RepID=UPI001CD31BF5|nr:hypothetical protein [Cesiribacter sp. SM1]